MTRQGPRRPRPARVDHRGPPHPRGSSTARRAEERATRRSNRLALLVVVGIAILLAAAWLLGSVLGGPAASPGASTRAGAAGPRPTGCPTSAPPALASGETRTVTVSTRKGTFVIDVRADLAPIAAANFVALAECGYYDGVVFHRLVPDFVIQGGDPTGTGSGGPGYTISDEPVTSAYRRGTVAMARTSAPNSQGSQFFIVLSDRNSLAQTNTYAIFGTVTSGMDVVDAIAAMPNSGPPNNTALDPVAMDSVTVSRPSAQPPAASP